MPCGDTRDMTTSSRRTTSANATLTDASVNKMVASRLVELQMKVELLEEKSIEAFAQIFVRATAARKVPYCEPIALILLRL